MNFLCPECQAKYRIADEKLAGRASAKMKCRKCGHVIDVHAAARVESVAPPPPPPRPPAKEPPNPAGGAALAAAPPVRRASLPPRPSAAPAPNVASRMVESGAPAGVSPLAAPLGTPTPPEALAPSPPAAVVPQPPAPPAAPEVSSATEIASSLPVAPALESLRPAALADEWFVGLADKPIGPLTLDALREKFSSRRAPSDSLVWRDGMPEWKSASEVPELAGALPMVPVLPPLPPGARPPPVSRALDEVPVVSESPEAIASRLGIRSRSGPNPLAYVAVAVALALGVTIGIVFFGRAEREEVVRYVQVPASAVPAPEPAASDSVAAAPSAAPEERAVPKKSGAGKPVGTAGSPAGGKPLLGLSGLGAAAPAGPVAGGGSDVAQGAAPGGQLDSASIQRVVSNFSPSVRRGCWQPALEARSEAAPTSARVVVTATVSPSGDVTNVSAGGDPSGYPGLSRCIASKVQSWRFPRSSGTTTVQVPFVFAAQ